MTGRPQPRTDHEILNMLHMRDHQGFSMAEIARHYGYASRGAVVGLLSRVMADSMKHFPPCDQDGTLAPDWWKKRGGKAT